MIKILEIKCTNCISKLIENVGLPKKYYTVITFIPFQADVEFQLPTTKNCFDCCHVVRGLRT